MKVDSIIPKMAPVIRALRAVGLTTVLVHTGQHYDDNMSDVFFRDLDIPKPEINLGVGSGSHAQQTGQMLIRLEETILREGPDTIAAFFAPDFTKGLPSGTQFLETDSDYPECSQS